MTQKLTKEALVLLSPASLYLKNLQGAGKPGTRRHGAERTRYGVSVTTQAEPPAAPLVTPYIGEAALLGSTELDLTQTSSQVRLCDISPIHKAMILAEFQTKSALHRPSTYCRTCEYLIETRRLGPIQPRLNDGEDADMHRYIVKRAANIRLFIAKIILKCVMGNHVQFKDRINLKGMEIRGRGLLLWEPRLKEADGNRNRESSYPPTTSFNGMTPFLWLDSIIQAASQANPLQTNASCN
ncbi:hypothetical protein V8F33_002547 [Rhypophila sp. PSN 637]